MSYHPFDGGFVLLLRLSVNLFSYYKSNGTKLFSYIFSFINILYLFIYLFLSHHKFYNIYFFEYFFSSPFSFHFVALVN